METKQVKLSPAQQHALDIIAAHPGRDPRTVYRKVRVATMRYLERQGLVTIKTVSVCDLELSRRVDVLECTKN